MNAGLFKKLLLHGFFLTAAPLWAEGNWPQWRGPQANGVAPGAKPPKEWSEAKNVKWKVKLPGKGTGTPILWGDQILLQMASPTGEKGAQITPPTPPPEGDRAGRGGRMRSEPPTEIFQFDLVSLDRTTGKVQWQKTLCKTQPHEGHHQDHGYASYSPVTDGKHIVAFYGSRGLYVTDMSGKVIWEKELGKMQTRAGFGEGSSPALSGEHLVINWDHEGEDFIACYQVATGKELWKQKRDEPTTWTTPLIVSHEGKSQVIVPATNKSRSYDLATGTILWECGGMTTNVIPCPVVREGVVFLMSGFRGAALQAIQLGKSGDLTDTDSILWTHDKNTPYVPSPLLSGERLYFFSGNNSILSCFHTKDGKPLIDAQRVEGASGFYASPVAADGHVYLVDRSGNSFVIKDSDSYQLVSINKLEEKFDASPAIIAGDIFLRGHEYLYRISESP